MGRIERSGNERVKASMDRARAVLCSLLPVLWVLAAGHCLADPVSGRAEGRHGTVVSAADHGGHAPLKDVRFFEQSARLLKRRVGTSIGWGGLSAPAVMAGSWLERLEYPFVFPTASTGALGLARCWQFYWRTALEPRAPSSVS
jgi:hypothetical protein